jgi:hypothetical protein
MDDNPDLYIIVVGSTTLDHLQVANRLQSDVSRIAVLRERFTLPVLSPDQNPRGENQLMSCLRLLAYAACRTGTPNPAAAYGETYTFALSRGFPLARVPVDPPAES